MGDAQSKLRQIFPIERRDEQRFWMMGMVQDGLRILDISRGGIGIRLPGMYDTVEEEMELVMNLPGVEQPVRLLGKLCWSSPDALYPGTTRVGLRFTPRTRAEANVVETLLLFLERRQQLETMTQHLMSGEGETKADYKQ